MDRHDHPPSAIAASDAEASRAGDAANAASGTARVVVWDVPAAIERGRRFTVKIGLTCSDARRSDGWQVEVRDHEGGIRATAAVGDEPWSGTDALYPAEVALVAPEAEGLYTWEAAAVMGVAAATGDGSATGGTAEPSGVAESAGAVASGGVAATGGAAEPGGVATTGGAAEPGGVATTGGVAEPGGVAATAGAAEPSGAVERDAAAEPDGAPAAHGGRARFGVRVVSAPACRVTVVALDAASRSPVEGARVVAHPYRAVTDERGMAELQVPAGEYRLFVSGRGSIPFRFEGAVTADTTIRAELEPDRELSDADIWS